MNRPIFITVLLALSLAVGFFLLWPRYQDLSGAQRKVKEKTAELERQEKYFNAVRALHKELQNYKRELTKIDAVFPQDSSLPSLYDLMQKLPSRSGLVLRGLTISPGGAAGAAPESSSRVKSIGVTLQVSGSYSAFKEFIARTRISPRILTIDSLSFSAPAREAKEGSSPEDVFTFSMNLKAYSY